MGRFSESMVERQLAIVNDKNNGMTVNELAKKYNLEKNNIWKILKEWSPTGKKYLSYIETVNRNKNIVKDRDSGKTYVELSTKYKLSRNRLMGIYNDWKFKAYDLDMPVETESTTADKQALEETLKRINKVINDEPFTKEEADEFNEKSKAMSIRWPAPKLSVDASEASSIKWPEPKLLIGSATITPAPDGNGVWVNIHKDAENMIPEKTKRSIISLYENECPTETILETFKIDIDTYKKILKDHYQTVLDAAMKIETPAKTYDPDAITKKLRRVSLTFFDICKLAGVKIRDSYTIEDIETGETYTVIDSNIIAN